MEKMKIMSVGRVFVNHNDNEYPVMEILIDEKLVGYLQCIKPFFMVVMDNKNGSGIVAGKSLCSANLQETYKNMFTGKIERQNPLIRKLAIQAIADTQLTLKEFFGRVLLDVNEEQLDKFVGATVKYTNVMLKKAD